MSLGTRITVLLFVLMAFFSVTAYTYDLSTFRLRIEDPNSGVGRVLTDNVTLGFGNSAGDQNSAAGTMYFSGYVENFLVNIQATSATSNSDGSGGGVLTLSGSVTYSGLSNAQLLITLEDSGYTAPAPTATFIGSIGGYNSATRTVTPTGGMTGATSVMFQSWLDVANNDPAFGPESGSTFLNSMTISSGTAIGAFAGDGQQYSTSDYAYTGGGVPVTFSGGNYSIFSQARVSFAGSGSANFTVQGADPPSDSVPEPTSLFLLGSALLGLGFLPKLGLGFLPKKKLI